MDEMKRELDGRRYFGITDRRTGSIIDTERHPYFKDYELMLTMDGKVAMLQYGEVICFADGRLYEARMVEGGSRDGDS